jgi:RimJ/RimL family protein N-acetyltransferase
MVGQLWIEPKWDQKIFEIGYFLGEDDQGLGYTTEAINKMIDTLFRQVDTNKLEIHTKATNTKSIGVAERCGFTREGILRERGRMNDGEVVDMLIFGLLRNEFEF